MNKTPQSPLKGKLLPVTGADIRTVMESNPSLRVPEKGTMPHRVSVPNHKRHRKTPFIPDTVFEILRCVKVHSIVPLDTSVSLGEFNVHLRLLKDHGLIVELPHPHSLSWHKSYQLSEYFKIRCFRLTSEALHFLESIDAHYPDSYWRGGEYVKDYI